MLVRLSADHAEEVVVEEQLLVELDAAGVAAAEVSVGGVLGGLPQVPVAHPALQVLVEVLDGDEEEDLDLPP